jgi:hypothetical protein
MPEWYETPPEKRTDEQRQRAQQAYYMALLSTREGKEVVCDMKRRVSDLIEGSANDIHCAVAQLWLEGFIMDTITMCGVDNPMQITEAQARIAKSYIHKEKEKNLPENYSE